MLQTQQKTHQVVFFKHFTRKSYAAFNSLKREVRICTLAACMLTYAYGESKTYEPGMLRHAEADREDITLDAAEVTGTRVPITFAETAQSISVITREDIERAKVQTVNDLLKLCAGVDVRQRGNFGVQTDVSIGGGTFDQIAILLNGININNPQTGHLTADFPVSVSDIERIEIYDGTSARIFGSQALNGAINIITRIQNADNGEARLNGGSYGTLGAGGSLNLASQHYLNRISADYLRSDGATNNSAFSKAHAFYQGQYITPELKLSWQGGLSSQRYDANTFYSAAYPNQWEAGSRWTASVKAVTNGRIHLAPSLSWIRSYDHFQLIKDTHTGENFHRNDVYTFGLTAYTEWSLGRTAFGGELRSEGILSSNLGRPLQEDQYVKVENQDEIYYTHRDNRTNISYFLEHALLLKNFSLTAGVMANRNTAVNERFSFYPGVETSYRPGSHVKLFASWGMSMRLPTFTDLYYKSPTQEGNVGLKPEKTMTVKAGGEYNHNGFFFGLNGIYRHGSNMIDWVMREPNDIYHSTQFTLDGFELSARTSLNFPQLMQCRTFIDRIKAEYTYIHQSRNDNQVVYKSNYALEYLRHKATFDLDHRVIGPIEATWQVSWQERMGGYVQTDGTVKSYSPYALLNLKLRYDAPRYGLYLSLENLTNHTYYDYGSIPQPGFTLMAGCRVSLNL